jgi:hypothetical protein
MMSGNLQRIEDGNEIEFYLKENRKEAKCNLQLDLQLK